MMNLKLWLREQDLSVSRFNPWTDMNIGGKQLVDNILQNIERADVFACDLTYPRKLQNSGQLCGMADIRHCGYGNRHRPVGHFSPVFGLSGVLMVPVESVIRAVVGVLFRCQIKLVEVLDGHKGHSCFTDLLPLNSVTNLWQRVSPGNF